MLPAFMQDPTKSTAVYDESFGTPPRAEYRGQRCRVEIVLRGDDLIYQFYGVRNTDFQDLLAEIIEAHFGKTDDFSVTYIPEVQSWGLRAKDVRANPFFNYDHFTVRFLDLVDHCLREAA